MSIEKISVADVMNLLGQYGSMGTAGPDHFVDGNVSPLELNIISAIMHQLEPKVCLEIGTFNGLTTAHLALNAAPDALIFTLDLPPGQTHVQGNPDPEDGKYIQAAARQKKFYAGRSYTNKIHELLGDSATYDFKGMFSYFKPGLVFIDASHSYEYVKNDTEKVMGILADDAIVLWHDYTGCWPGVVRYLDELSATLPLKLIEGTCLVYYRKKSK